MSHSSHDTECADFLERIVYFLDNELDQADCAQIQQHLDDCGPCLARYDLERTVKTLVARSCTEVAPDGLRQRVMLSIRQVQVRPPRTTTPGGTMGKTGRKRRGRKKKNANHGKRPNA